LVVDAI